MIDFDRSILVTVFGCEKKLKKKSCIYIFRFLILSNFRSPSFHLSPELLKEGLAIFASYNKKLTFISNENLASNVRKQKHSLL